MLIVPSRNELTPAYIRDFCRSFDEGIRVEYKGTFNDDVREKLPKIVSSFANSEGGVILIGVRTQQGKPVEPIIGFDKPTKEELTLTVENICHQHIYPIVTPKVTEVPSDQSGKLFLLIEVDPSPLAPHAIENSRKVYIRTGNASNPYDLADIDMIERLIKRRENILARRNRFESDAHGFRQRFVSDSPYPKLIVIVGPRFPHSQLTDRQTVFRFLMDSPFTGSHFYNRNQIRRLPDGACGSRDNDMFGYLETYGHLFHQEVLECVSPGDNRPTYYRQYELIHPILQALYCTSRFYKVVGYRGDLSITAKLWHGVGQIMCAWRVRHGVEYLLPPIDLIPAEIVVASELIWRNIVENATAIIHQLIWPMKVGPELEPLEETQVRTFVESVLADYKP